MKRNTNSATPDLIERMADMVGKLEERLMKKVEEKMPVSVGENMNMIPTVISGPGAFSLPANVAEQVQEVMKHREDSAYSKGLQVGMMIGGAAVGLILFRSLFR